MLINKSYPCDARNYRRGRRDTIKYIVIHYVGATGSALANVKILRLIKRRRKARTLRGPRKRGRRGVSKRRPERLCGTADSDPGGRYYHPSAATTTRLGIELCCHKDSHGDWYFDSATVQKRRS